MWSWVIIALASLVIVILLVLFIPLDLIIQVDTSKRPAFKIRLLWLFGLIAHDLKKTRRKPREQRKAVTAREKKRGRGIRPDTIYRILRTTGLFSQVKQLLTGIVNSIKIKHLAANLKLGLENPADTALLFAITGPVNFLLSLLPYDITIWPTFDSDLAIEACMHGAARLWPVLLIFTLLKFIFSLPALRIAKALVMTRWKKA